MDKIKPVKFEVTGGEVYDRDIGRSADTWEGFNSILWDMSKHAPDGGCYDKVDFKITFADGETYDGRYDLEHHTVKAPDIREHVASLVGCVTGRIRPDWMNDSQWEQTKARYTEIDGGTLLSNWNAFADKYDVGVS